MTSSSVQQVRCRLLDRVGQLSHVPCLRFIYIDPDPDAPDKALSAPPDIALPTEPGCASQSSALISVDPWASDEA